MSEPGPTVLGGRYELRGELGRGGMAEVHRAVDRVLSREVAVKLMHTATLDDDVDRRRFAAETRLLAGLNDPHLVMVLDAGVDESSAGSRPYIVMELVTGSTMAHRIESGPLSRSEVATIGAGLASALAHVHAAGIVHRDVKPANVLLTTTGTAKLADFGIARMSGEASALTQTGHTIGTAAYLAPEQVSGRPVTGASDVYTLGLVLLEALTGQRAYTGTPLEAAFARLQRSPLIPTSLGAEWIRLLDEMTAQDPAARPTAAVVAQRLAAQTGAPRSVPPPPTSDPTRTQQMASVGAVGSTAADVAPTRRPAGLLVAAAAALVLVLAAAWLVQGSDPEPAAAAPTSAPATTSEPSPTRSPSAAAAVASSTPSADPVPTPVPTPAAARAVPPPAKAPGPQQAAPSSTPGKGKGTSKGKGKPKGKGKGKSKGGGKGKGKK